MLALWSCRSNGGEQSHPFLVAGGKALLLLVRELRPDVEVGALHSAGVHHPHVVLEGGFQLSIRRVHLIIIITPTQYYLYRHRGTIWRVTSGFSISSPMGSGVEEPQDLLHTCLQRNIQNQAGSMIDRNFRG